MLQRCGWTFWRVRGGEFYRDPDAAMNDLWRTLDLLGIQPYSSESYSKVAQVAPVTQPQDQPQEESEPRPAVAIKEGSRERSALWAPTRKRQLNLFPSDGPLLAQATVQETETVYSDQTITVVPVSPLNNGDLVALIEAAKTVLTAGRAGYFKPADRAKVRRVIASLVGGGEITSFGVKPDKLSDESLARELMRLAGNTDVRS